MIVRPAPIWTEAVFHVLAHADVGALPASCYNCVYIAWVAERLGSASERTLAQDARVIARASLSHDALARAQALAWVFGGQEECARVAELELAALGAADVMNVRALEVALGAGALTEVVRAAAELELPALASVVDLDARDRRSALEAALDEVASAAPSLAAHDVASVRALGLRGRAFERSILVGAPGISCPDAEHAAWQAAHEATVVEVSREASSQGATFEEVERRALVRLRSRARASGLADAHARWLARLDLRPPFAIPDVDDRAE